MRPTTDDLRRAKAAVLAAFGDGPGIVGVGIGDGVVRVYVRDAAAGEAVAAADFGVPIELVVTGDVRASPGTETGTQGAD